MVGFVATTLHHDRPSRTTGCQRTRVTAVLLLLAACVEARAERLPVKVYNTADGLAHNHVNQIVRDSRGFLWFCTDDGLSRFDGYAFRTFGIEHGLPHSSVTDFLETRGGELWVATKGGLVRFDPTGTPHNRHSRDEAPARPMFSLVPNDDPRAWASRITVLRETRDARIWAGTYNGLYRLEEANGRRSLKPVDLRMPTEFPEQREVTDILEDSRGTLWIAALSGLYRRFPDGAAARYTEREGLPSAALSDLFEDRAGRMWAATIERGYFGFRAGGDHAAPAITSAYNMSDGLPSYWVFRMFETSDGRMWIATANGLAQPLPSASAMGHRVRAYGASNGVTDHQVIALAEDRSGNLWMGTGNSGAVKLTHGGFTSYAGPDAIRAVHAIFEDRPGQACFRADILGNRHRTVFEGAVLDVLNEEGPGAHGRLGCVDGSRLTWFYPSAVRSFGWVGQGTTLKTRGGEWWVGTGEGIFRYAPVARMTDLRNARPLAVYGPAEGLPTAQVFQLFEDSRGDIWASTTSGPTQGLARWDRATARWHDLAQAPNMPPLTDNTARAFGEDRAGAVWIGFNRGLGRYRDGRFTFFTTREGLPPGDIRDIHLDRAGRLWLASAQSGLIRVDEDDAAGVRFVSFTTAQGLSSSNTDVIAEDRDGRIFVGGGRGLDRLDPATGRVRHFTTADGLIPGPFRAALFTVDGVLWVGTGLGLARMEPGAAAASGPPPIVIDGVRVRGVQQDISVLGERALSLAALPPHQNQLQIDFVGLSFESGESLRYQYKLGDAEWSAPGFARSVTFASLPPGRHTFLVRASNSEGVLSPEPATLTFTILAPVWLRWWFLTLAGATLVLAIHGLYRRRLTRLLEIADMRMRIATDLHDDIGANLTRIALLSEVARQANSAERQAKDATAGRTPDTDVLLSIARIARESVASMGDIVWAINPRRETLVDLTRRMRQHADELFTARAIELRFDTPPAARNPRLGVEVRRELLLIFKEAVSNAAKHSQCSIVVITLSCDVDRLTLQITDNGIGFDPSAEPGDGQGCPSMRKRAERLNGHFRIVSSKGAGTTVGVVVPL